MKCRRPGALLLVALAIFLFVPSGCEESSAAVPDDEFWFTSGAYTTILSSRPYSSPAERQTEPGPAAEVRLPVLMYHHVGEPAPDASDLTRRLTVSTASFEEQMNYLRQAGYETVSQYQLYRAMYFGEPLPPKPVMLTLDDGFIDNYTVAAPVLQKYGHTATFFVITEKVGIPGYMNWDQLIELDRLGMDIGSHTARHPDLNNLGGPELNDEIDGSAIALNARLGHEVYWLCYPSGKFSNAVIEHTAAAGYLAAYTTIPGEVHNAGNTLAKPRWRIGPGTDMEEFARLVDATA